MHWVFWKPKESLWQKRHQESSILLQLGHTLKKPKWHSTEASETPLFPLVKKKSAIIAQNNHNKNQTTNQNPKPNQPTQLKTTTTKTTRQKTTPQKKPQTKNLPGRA